MTNRNLALLLLVPVLVASSPQDPEGDARAAVVAALAAEGVQLDFEGELASIRGRVLVREDLLEYYLVGLGGAGHESLFETEAQPSLLNTALLALGAKAGTNAVWTAVEPPPTLEERRAGRRSYEITPPAGDGFYLYVGWREGGETYFFRAEDLVSNLLSGRSMRRQRWVYLGSRFAPIEPNGADVFVADHERNLVNITYFRGGNTLLTGALPECEEQSIWVANAWLVPERGTEVQLVFSRRRLDSPPASLLALLPGSAEPAGPPVVDEGEDG